MSVSIGEITTEVRPQEVATPGSAAAGAGAPAASPEEERRKWLAELQRQIVRAARGTAEGNPAIRVGTHVTLAGLGPRFSNTYYVVRCCHRFDLTRGYETDFTAESAYLGNPA